MIERELRIFLIVGLLTVAIDFAIYCGFMYSNLLITYGVNLAKGIGFIGGTIFAYFANRFWTFSQQTAGHGSVGRFILVYLLSLGANIVLNHLSISWLAPLVLAPERALFTAFIIATGISAILNFIGMKFFVFTNFQRPIID